MSFAIRLVFPALLVMSAIGSGPTSGSAQTMPPAVQSDQDHSAHHPAGDIIKPSAAPSPQQMPMGAAERNDQTGMMTMMDAANDMMASHVEDRIASLKTQLEITQAQGPQWSHFANALREVSKSVNGMHQQMMQRGGSGTLPNRLEAQEAMLSTHLTVLKALKDALDPLYASFSDGQKKRADALMVGPMGVM